MTATFFRSGRVLKVLAPFLILVLCVWYFNYRSIRMKISPETTVLTEPLTEDGRYVDYFSYLRSHSPAGMKSEKNAACGILRLFYGFSDDEKADSQFREDVFQLLGMEPTEPKFRLPDFTLDFEKFLLARFPNELKDPAEKAAAEEARNAFDRQDWAAISGFEPFARQWLEANAPALDALEDVLTDAELLRFPVCSRSKRPTLVCLVFYGTLELRRASLSLAFRANWYVSQGNLEEAIADCLACRKLGALLQKEPLSLIDFLMGTGIESIAVSVPIARNPDAQPTLEQWRRLADAASSLEPDRPMGARKALLFERFCCADFIQRFSESFEEIGDPFVTALLELSDVRLPYCWEPGVDWNEVAKETLRHQDWDVLLGKFWEKKRAEASGKALSETAADSEGLEDFGDSEESCRLWGWFQSRKSRSRRMAKQMTKEFFWVEGFPLTLERQIDRRQVERIGQAMQCWRLEHDGKLPPAFTTDSEGRPLHS